MFHLRNKVVEPCRHPFSVNNTFREETMWMLRVVKKNAAGKIKGGHSLLARVAGGEVQGQEHQVLALRELNQELPASSLDLGELS